MRTKIRTGSETDRQTHTNRQSVRQTDTHGNFIYFPVYREAFLLPNVITSNNKRIIRTEATNLFKFN